jgi:hypothetical protein
MRYALTHWPDLSRDEQQLIERAFQFFYQTHRGQPPMSSGEICCAFESRNDLGAGRVIALDRSLSMEA